MYSTSLYLLDLHINKNYISLIGVLMNFKIYIEDGLLDLISPGTKISFSRVNRGNYISLINNHLASKVSQRFLFFISINLAEKLNTVMQKHRQSVFQFVIIDENLNDIGERLPLDSVLSVTRGVIDQENFSWLLSKFESIISRTKISTGITDIETKDLIEDQTELIGIGQLLAKERNRDKLIQKILKTSIKITGADAGCVFLVVDNADGTKGLLFKYSYTFSRDIDFNEFVMPMDEKSIAGFCAVNDEVVNIPDVYEIPDTATFSFNSSIDKRYDYISRSMLVFPMKNHLGEMLGVIQLINSKEHFDNLDINDTTESYKILLETKEDFYNKVYPFALRYEDLMLSVAGQASIALDNIKMIHQLEEQFEGMVRASVDAIDSKDPATSGHSFRVAQMSLSFLTVLNGLEHGQFAGISFSPREMKQMEYAALLHDYGKVYIDNDIFLKAKKLFPKDFKILMLRLDLIAEKLKNLPNGNVLIEEVQKVKEKIRRLNDPKIFNEKSSVILDEIINSMNGVNLFDGEGKVIPILTPGEIDNLNIARGTLNKSERSEVQSHVKYTYDFLQSIPWPKDLARIPEIAGGHHEMLDGSGYPNKLAGNEICIESRILAILDIFDALSASDRPYKKPIPFDEVKSILEREADKDRLDKELVKLFFDHKVYEGLYTDTSVSLKI